MCTRYPSCWVARGNVDSKLAQVRLLHMTGSVRIESRTTRSRIPLLNSFLPRGFDKLSDSTVGPHYCNTVGIRKKYQFILTINISNMNLDYQGIAGTRKKCLDKQYSRLVIIINSDVTIYCLLQCYFNIPAITKYSIDTGYVNTFF